MNNSRIATIGLSKILLSLSLIPFLCGCFLMPTSKENAIVGNDWVFVRETWDDEVLTKEDYENDGDVPPCLEVTKDGYTIKLDNKVYNEGTWEFVEEGKYRFIDNRYGTMNVTLENNGKRVKIALDPDYNEYYYFEKK